ncbi:hypothetical protein M422DRAFT_271227 [Sphaerobolus stellatus SS14]|uniref:Uncharacterized protein n=1 Tax=Sphaerobolus stellatus (strain SS14) TaxID=990650 RepID=A0A0C9TE71_SPHS4|nr:hypothetical protein M422DRAFT_271227 [Sphaerobolus stellatus SS14]
MHFSMWPMLFEDTEHIICVDFTAAVQFAYNVEDYTLEQHPRLTALALYIWSCYPEAPFRLLRTIIWDFPKAILQGFLGCLEFKNEGIERGKNAQVSRKARNDNPAQNPSPLATNRGPSMMDTSPKIACFPMHSHTARLAPKVACKTAESSAPSSWSL